MLDVGSSTLVDRWREILAQHAAVWCALDHELSEKHQLSASEFEVLERLADSAVGRYDGLRVQEIADAVHLSQSALSRLVGRLEKAGLVARSLCTIDRRGIYVKLTAAGAERYQQARPTHRAVLSAELDD